MRGADRATSRSRSGLAVLVPVVVTQRSVVLGTGILQRTAFRCVQYPDGDSMVKVGIRRFVDALSAQESIASQLPFYVSGLPYYQRLLATALASSLQRSLPRTGDDMQALLKDLPERLTIASTVGSRKT